MKLPFWRFLAVGLLALLPGVVEAQGLVSRLRGMLGGDLTGVVLTAPRVEAGGDVRFALFTESGGRQVLMVEIAARDRRDALRKIHPGALVEIVEAEPSADRGHLVAVRWSVRLRQQPELEALADAVGPWLLAQAGEGVTGELAGVEQAAPGVGDRPIGQLDTPEAVAPTCPAASKLEQAEIAVRMFRIATADVRGCEVAKGLAAELLTVVGGQ